MITPILNEVKKMETKQPKSGKSSKKSIYEGCSTSLCEKFKICYPNVGIQCLTHQNIKLEATGILPPYNFYNFEESILNQNLVNSAQE